MKLINFTCTFIILTLVITVLTRTKRKHLLISAHHQVSQI
jgi:hypothetical protein